MFLAITAESGSQPAWYLDLSAILSLFFVIFEVKRTCGFTKEQRKVNMLARATSLAESVIIEGSYQGFDAPKVDASNSILSDQAPNAHFY